MGNDEIFEMEWRFINNLWKINNINLEYGLRSPKICFSKTPLKTKIFFEGVNFSSVIEKYSKKDKFAPDRMKLKLG